LAERSTKRVSRKGKELLKVSDQPQAKSRWKEGGDFKTLGMVIDGKKEEKNFRCRQCEWEEKGRVPKIIKKRHINKGVLL